MFPKARVLHGGADSLSTYSHRRMSAAA
jgi:hypothetical protein